MRKPNAPPKAMRTACDADQALLMPRTAVPCHIHNLARLHLLTALHSRSAHVRLDIEAVVLVPCRDHP